MCVCPYTYTHWSIYSSLLKDKVIEKIKLIEEKGLNEKLQEDVMYGGKRNCDNCMTGLFAGSFSRREYSQNLITLQFQVVKQKSVHCEMKLSLLIAHPDHQNYISTDSVSNLPGWTWGFGNVTFH